MDTRRVSIPLLSVIAGATLVGPIAAVMAGPVDQVNPQVPESAVCYDDVGNTRYIKASDSCKPDEHRAKILPSMTPDPADDPTAQLQKQVADLMAKVSALQAQVNTKADAPKADKPAPEGAPLQFIDPKTEKQIRSLVQELVAQDNNPAGEQKGTMKAPKDPPATKSPSSSSGGGSTQRVTAPFEVVDSKGTVLLRVSEDSSNAQGAHITIGRSGGGHYGIRVFNDSGQFVTGVGQSQAGGGLVVVGEGGNSVVTMSASDHGVTVFKGKQSAAQLAADDNGGNVVVFTASGEQVIRMLNRGAGGDIVVSRPDGAEVFEATVSDEGSGLACLGRGADLKNRCLGKGLPLQMN